MDEISERSSMAASDDGAAPRLESSESSSSGRRATVAASVRRSVLGFLGPDLGSTKAGTSVPEFAPVPEAAFRHVLEYTERQRFKFKCARPPEPYPPSCRPPFCRLPEKAPGDSALLPALLLCRLTVRMSRVLRQALALAVPRSRRGDV